MKELVEAIAKALVDNPDQLQVRAIEGEQVTVLELRVHPSDVGKVIGRQGRTVQGEVAYTLAVISYLKHPPSGASYTFK